MDTSSPAIVETHVSVLVFLGDRVLKVKKPVTTGFLDFSTVERRRSACETEVTLNRRLAPDVYLGTGALAMPDGDEPVVVMRRMPAERRLAHLVRLGRVEEATVVELARVLARFHAEAHRSAEIERAGTAEHVRGLWVSNFDDLAAWAGAPLPGVVLGEIEGLALSYVAGRGPLFADRIAAGRIVDGHGDLLADDIFCLPDGPRILDCIEFADRFRHGDVLLDLAFLAMDLERLGAPQLAERLLEAYREHAAETHPRTLEHHYIAYRALVRAKVACYRADQGDPGATAEAMARLSQCLAHLRSGRVRLVLVGGLPGTGKTTLADALGAQLGWTVLRSDEIRKELTGVGPRPAPAAYGEGIYDPQTTARTYEGLLGRAAVALARGECVIADASWNDGTQRARAAAVAHDAHAELVELRCVAPRTVAEQRIARRLAEGLDLSDATAEIAQLMATHTDPWPSAVVVDTGGTVAAAVADALAALGAPGEELASTAGSGTHG